MVTVLTGAVGNTSLVPDSANTTTVGGDQLPARFKAVGRLLRIITTKAISALTAQQTLDQCAGRVTQLGTNDIIRNSSGGVHYRL